MTEQKHTTPRYSPFSNPVGEYPDNFSEHEQLELANIEPYLGSKNLTEVAIPYISREILTSATTWFAEELMAIVNNRGINTVVVTYNMDGAQWFWHHLRAILLQLEFPINQLTAVSIKVSTSTGLRTFKPEVNQAKLQWPTDAVLQGKTVISLDDIGDSGFTQAAITDLAIKSGAKEVITVNLIEKILPAEKTKYLVPNYALLVAAYKFLIGGGLDSGTNDMERENRFRALSLIAILEQSLIQPKIIRQLPSPISDEEIEEKAG